MRILLVIIISSFFLNNCISGEENRLKTLSESELNVINDLSFAFNDSSISCVISPVIFHSVDNSFLEIDTLIKNYGFCKQQFEYNKKDTFLIRSNKYQNLIHSDSLIKYINYEVENMPQYHKKKDFNISPLLHYIRLNFNKREICFFNNPIISPNGQYAIAEYWFYCGSLCGRGEIVLMKKLKNKWTKVETLSYHIS